MTSQILVVDDNPVQSATRSAILTRSGAKVLVCSRPQEVLLLLERPDIRSQIALMVTDHLMPEMNGPDLVRRVRAILPNLPVLVLSGLSEAENEYETLDVSFRLKPFPPNQLIEATQALMSPPALRLA